MKLTIISTNEIIDRYPDISHIEITSSINMISIYYDSKYSIGQNIKIRKEIIKEIKIEP